MKLYNLSILFISSMNVLLPSVLAKKDLQTCKAVFNFPKQKAEKRASCQTPEISSILAAQGLAYQFASGFFATFDVANIDDTDNIERHSPTELAGYYDEFFVMGRPRGQGIDNRHLKQDDSSPSPLDHLERRLNGCACCETCPSDSYFCSFTCGQNCRECRRRNLRSTKFEQNHRGLLTMQEADPNLCTMNPITVSTAFTEIVNEYFKINCVMKRDYLMYLGSSYYYISVDDKTGQQIGIKDMGDWI